MPNKKYEVKIWFDQAQKPEDDKIPGRVETQRVDSKEQAKEFIEETIWQVDNMEENGEELPDGRKEYGFWSKTKDRQTGKQWYQWATIEVRSLEIEQIDTEHIISDLT